MRVCSLVQRCRASILDDVLLFAALLSTSSAWLVCVPQHTQFSYSCQRNHSSYDPTAIAPNVDTRNLTGEYAYALVLLLIPLALQGRRLSTLHGDKTLVTAVLVVATFEVFGALLFCAASAWPEPSEEALGAYLKVADVAGYMLVFGVRACVPRQPSNQQRLPGWVGPKTVMACVLGYSCTVTALLSWQVAAVLALVHVPLLVAVGPLRKSVISWGMVLGMIISSPAQWSSVLGWATAHASGTSVVLRWLRMFRSSGLLNLPLMCLVSMPTHLTIAFVLLS